MYHFFFKRDSPFCQWHRSVYVFKNEQFYNCEQGMMWSKAMLFNDIDTAKKILETKNPSEAKKLGRQVKNFNEKIWDKNKQKIVYEHNFQKFTQNERLKRALLATGTLILAEASPFDCIWGIGLSEDNPLAQDESNWRGQNLLGKILTKLRYDLSS